METPRLPATLDTGFVLSGTDWPWAPEGGVVVRAGGAPIRHAEPAALVALAAWSGLTRARGASVVVDASVQSPYSWRFGVLSALTGDVPRVRAAHATDDLLPICWFTGRHDAEKELGPSLVHLIHGPSMRAAQAIGSAVKELAFNAAEHGKSPHNAWFSGGWFRNQRRVTFAVADLGPTIRGHLDRKGLVRPDEDDGAAIEKALQKGVTGAGEPGRTDADDNGGLGLFLTREYVRSCDGEMLIWSGAACFRQDGHDRDETSPTPVRWPGTLVSVTLRPDEIGAYATTTREWTSVSLRLRYGEAGPGAEVVTAPVDSVGFASDKDWAVATRPRLAAAVEEGRPFHVDFRGARYSTQSALHALFYTVVRDRGRAALALLSVSPLDGPISQVLQHVLGYAMEANDRERAAGRLPRPRDGA